jgi:hypothetical protein
VFFRNLFIKKSLCLRHPVFLESDPDWRYNTLNKQMASVMWVNERNASGGQTMKKYYYKFWVPFVANKRRILLR